MRPLRTTTSLFLDTIRFWEWYPMLRQNTFAAIILLAATGMIVRFSSDLVIFILYSISAFSFGFLINNFADRRIDITVGKDHFHGFSKTTLYLWAGVFFAALIALPFYYQNTGITLAVITGLIIGICYSVPPIRLKERGFVGVVATIVAQRLPFILFYFILPVGHTLALYLLVWLIIDGIIIELGQQNSDRSNDTATGTTTYITSISIKQALMVFYLMAGLLIAYILLPLLAGAGMLTIVLAVFSLDALRTAHEHIHALHHYGTDLQ